MKPSTWFALLLIFSSMVASAVVSRHVFERLPHLEDEFAYLYQARIFANGEIYIETPQPSGAYWQPFLIDYEGKRFGKYPPGWPLLLALGAGNGTPWVVNVWFAGLVVALVYRIGRDLYNETAGLAAALLMTSSPIALLLNGSLMGHTSALFFTLLFAYALWRLEQGKQRMWWGASAGLGLGWLLASRPLTAIGIAIPFVAYSLFRVAYSTFKKSTPHPPQTHWRLSQLRAVVSPLLLLGLVTMGVGSLWAGFNQATVGDPTANLYTFIWEYDKVGFGDDYGLNGHTPQEGWETTQQDMGCYARDLLGWVGQPDNPPQTITQGEECLTDQPGYSWILLPFGLLLMPRRRWTLLWLLLIGSLITVHMAYWIGAGVYSARYYYEATGAVMLVSGAGVAGLVRVTRQWQLQGAVVTLLIILVLMSVLGYTPRRLESLHGYGRITADLIQEVETMRQAPEKPVLVIAYGDHHWRDVGALMGITDPYTRHDIILLRDRSQSNYARLVARYPDRQILLFLDGRLQPVEG